MEGVTFLSTPVWENPLSLQKEIRKKIPIFRQNFLKIFGK